MRMRNGLGGREPGIGLALVLTLTLMAGRVAAMEFAHGDQVTLASGQVVGEDWYAAGNHVTLAGRVDRGAFIVGRQVVTLGTVGQDLNVAAEMLTVNSPVAGSVRLIGRAIEITAPISESALIAAHTLRLDEKAEVGRDMVAAGQRIRLDGTVTGRIQLIADTVEINGTLNGTVNVKARQVRIGPNAKIQGAMVYQSPNAMTVAQGAQVTPNVEWQRGMPKKERRALLGVPIVAGTAFLFFRIFGQVALWVAGIALIALLPAASRRYVQVIHDRPWPSVLWGAATLVGIPMIMLMLVVTLVGIPLALLLVPVYILALWIAQLAAGYLIGLWIYGEGAHRRPFLAFTVGFLIFVILKFIPILGGLVQLAGLLLGLGAWWLLRRKSDTAVGPAVKDVHVE